MSGWLYSTVTQASGLSGVDTVDISVLYIKCTCWSASDADLWADRNPDRVSS